MISKADPAKEAGRKITKADNYMAPMNCIIGSSMLSGGFQPLFVAVLF